MTEKITSRNAAVINILEQVKQLASSDFSIIIQGEAGTGKTTLAHIIHDLGKGPGKPFITVDINAVPEALIEDELFGYEKGVFEMACGGTILIAGIQKLSAYVQTKVLRVIEEKKVYHLGGTRAVDTNARIIATTTTDLKRAVCEKNFREDLYLCLSEHVITIPPLRERPEDIQHLANIFFAGACSELGRNISKIADSTMDLLRKDPWKGNVRELKNVIRRAVILCKENVLKPEHIEFISSGPEVPYLLPQDDAPPLSLRNMEKMAIKRALDHTKGKRTKAAALLEIDYKTLVRKIRVYNIQ